MPVVVLAETDGQFWLVQGDEHMSALVMNALPDDVTVEIIECGTVAEVLAAWHERSAAAAPGMLPWAINPGIVARIRVPLDRAPRAVRFGTWSAMLDDAAQADLAAAATWLANNPGGRVVLRQFVLPGAAAGQDDLQRLRGQLALAVVLRNGGAAEAVTQESRAGAADADADRMEIVAQKQGDLA